MSTELEKAVTAERERCARWVATKPDGFILQAILRGDAAPELPWQEAEILEAMRRLAKGSR